MTENTSRDHLAEIVNEIMALSPRERTLLKRRLAICEAAESGDFKVVGRLATLESSSHEPEAYSPEEFAAQIGRPAGTVRRWLREGNLKGKQINRSWVIPHSELERITNPD